MRAARVYLLVFAGFLLVGFALYYPCLKGPFISDDLFAVLNPHGAPLSIGKIIDLFSPYGAATTMHSEYRPLWFLLHAVERHLFGDSVGAFHAVNVVLHSLVSGLLTLLLLRSGLPPGWALFGGIVFLVHPANVEAVAWISQLTSSVALALALGALLLIDASAPIALLCFVLALLTKPLAAFALPVAALFNWLHRDDSAARAGWRRLAGWTAVFAVFAGIELIAARGAHYGVEPMHPDGVVVARTIVGNFLRYVAMAATGYGVGAFQQARPAISWIDAWWLAGTAVIGLMAWRAAHTLKREQPEGVYWAWALLSFAPVSQVIPFTHPVADRYLYFILPGLLGGALLAAHHVVRVAAPSRRALVVSGVRVLAVLIVVVFAIQTRHRAELWTSFENLAQDSTRQFPDGLWAHLLRARAAAEKGDGERSTAELRRAFELGHREYGTIVADPAYGPVLRHPQFQQLLVEMADWWIRRITGIDNPNQMHLYQLASAYWLRGNFTDAQRTLERALALGGPFDERIRVELSRFRGRELR